MAVVLAVICLPVILMSLETDAQPTVDETTSFGSSTLEEVVEMIRSIQQENAREIRKLREEMMDEIRNLKTQLVSNTTECECVAAKPSKQELISAFVG